MRILGKLGRAVLLALCVCAATARAELPDSVAFSWAVESGDIRKVKSWLDEGLSPDFQAKPLGSGLMIAAWYGNIEMMSLFVERGADVRSANHNGEQALQLAAWQGRPRRSSGCLTTERRSTATGRIGGLALRRFQWAYGTGQISDGTRCRSQRGVAQRFDTVDDGRSRGA